MKASIKKVLGNSRPMLGLASALVLSCTGMLNAGAEDLKLNIESQKVGTALMLLGEQAGVQITLPRDLGDRLKTPSINGQYTLSEALDTLLKDSGLVYEYLSDYAVVIKEGAPAAGRAGTERGGKKQVEIDEIIVTATKREEGLQSVPISISAFTAQEIKNAGSNSVKDLAGSIPNFTFPESYSPLQSDISIRGIFSPVVPSELGFDVGYGVYLDGVFLGKQFGANADLGDIERLEVLRGPQGTLFGKNTIAGAINIITKKPDHVLGGGVELDVGNLNLKRLRGSVNVPLVDDVLAMRVSVTKVKRDGYVTNTTLNEGDYANVDQVSGRLHLAFTPTDNTRAYLSIDHLDSEGKNYGWETADSEPYVITGNVANRYALKNLGAALTIEHDFANGYSVASITGVRNDSSTLLNDEDQIAMDGLASITDWKQRVVTQELRLISPADTWYDFVAGIHYFDQANDRDLSYFLGQDWVGPVLAGSGTTINSVDVSSWAVYTHANFHLTEQITLFGGARYTDEKKTMKFFQTSNPAFILPIFGGAVGDQGPIPEIGGGEATWTLGLRYEPSDNFMTYGSVSKGFKSGGYNSGFFLAVGDFADNLVVEPEFVTSYEIGFKSSWWDHRLTLNTALFYMAYEDLQVRTFDPDGGVNGSGQVRLQNAAEVTSKGLELELVARPIEQLTFNLGVGYLDSTFDDYQGVPLPRGPGSDGDDKDGVIDGFTNAAGNHVPLSPEWTANAAAQYEIPLGNGAALLARLDYRYTDEFFSGVTGTADEILPGYGLLNARLGYRSADEQWGLYLWARNLTDQHKIQSSGFSNFITGPRVSEKYIEPRTYGVSLNYNF